MKKKKVVKKKKRDNDGPNAHVKQCPRCGMYPSQHDELTMMGRKCWHCGGFY